MAATEVDETLTEILQKLAEANLGVLLAFLALLIVAYRGEVEYRGRLVTVAVGTALLFGFALLSAIDWSTDANGAVWIGIGVALLAFLSGGTVLLTAEVLRPEGDQPGESRLPEVLFTVLGTGALVIAVGWAVSNFFDGESVDLLETTIENPESWWIVVGAIWLLGAFGVWTLLTWRFKKVTERQLQAAQRSAQAASSTAAYADRVEAAVKIEEKVQLDHSGKLKVEVAGQLTVKPAGELKVRHDYERKTYEIVALAAAVSTIVALGASWVSRWLPR